MQHPWWFTVRNLVTHALGNSMVFVFVTLLFVCDSALLEFAGHLIHSRFVFRMLVVLEYAFLVSDLIAIGIALMANVLNSLKRIQ